MTIEQLLGFIAEFYTQDWLVIVLVFLSVLAASLLELTKTGNAKRILVFVSSFLLNGGFNIDQPREALGFLLAALTASLLYELIVQRLPQAVSKTGPVVSEVPPAATKRFE